MEKAKRLIEGEQFACPHCQVLLYDREKSVFNKCPHLVFSYGWGGEPDIFFHVKKDYAAKLLRTLKGNPEYREYIDELKSYSQEICSPEQEKMFANGSFDSANEVYAQYAKFGYFPELLSLDVVLYCDEGYHSGICIAIDPNG